MPSIDNKKKSQKNKLLYIFLTAFFVSLITIFYLATAFTPDIDVDVNSGETAAETDGDRPDIDSRLKELQQDELISASPKRDDDQSSSEIIDQLKKLKEEALEKQRKHDEPEAEVEEQKTEQHASAPANTQKPTPASKMAKVYVGRYSSFDEAIKDQDRLINGNLAQSPFIKNLGSHYVIQVGSFASQQTAQNIAEKLIEHGYSARMVFE